MYLLQAVTLNTAKVTLAVTHKYIGSIVVNIPACHAGDRGLIPCQGAILLM